MEKIDFKKDKIPFTQVANEVLNDKKLSAKAKGLYAYLYSKPEGWDFALDRIARDFADGRKSINAGLQELELNGYLYRERQSTGRVLYLLKSQMPKMDMGVLEPNAQNGKVPKRQSAEMGTVSNKEVEVIKKDNISITLNNKEEEIVGLSDKISKTLAVSNKLGEFQNVKITAEERDKLHAKLGEQNTEILVEELSGYLAATPKKYASHYAVILNWARRRVMDHQKRIQPKIRSIAFMKNDDLL